MMCAASGTAASAAEPLALDPRLLVYEYSTGLILRPAQVELVESRRKRSMFLEKVVYEANLNNATVCNIRSETLAAGAYVGVISRAYKPPQKVLTDAARLLVPGGRVVLLLGSQAALDAPAGWRIVDKHRYPVADGQRLRVVLERERDT